MNFQRLILYQAARLCGLVCFMFLVSLPPPVYAQTYTKGYAHYTRGDFKGAISAFRQSLARKRPTNRDERAQLFKYMGISYYMLGEKRNAARSFAAGLRLNQSLSIEAKEVLDENVIPFFKKVEKRVKATTESQLAAENENADPPLPGIISTILIQSNADQAEVVKDGKIIGRVNRAFDAKPGVIEVEVRAKGYESRLVRLSIKPKQSHNFEVKLKPEAVTGRRRPDNETAENRNRRVILPPEKEFEPIRPIEEQPPTADKRATPTEIPLPVSGPVAEKPRSNPASPQASSQQFSFLSLFPFGIGQFHNGYYFLGTVFAMSEVGLLGLYYQSFLQEDFTRNEATEFIERESREGTVPFEVLEQFRLESNQAIQKEQQKQQLYLAGFGVLWVSGIVHAILTSPPRTGMVLQESSYPSLVKQKPNSDSRIGITPTHNGWALQLEFYF
ncbi:MAG: hypothetical protein ACOH5I_02115 [Oligoflexus sp.]